MSLEERPQTLNSEMLKTMNLIAFLLATAAMAFIPFSAIGEEFKTPSEVVKEFHEAGHIPQGLKPSSYHPLKEVIAPEAVSEIRAKKLRKKKNADKKLGTEQIFSNPVFNDHGPIKPTQIMEPAPSPSLSPLESHDQQASPEMISSGVDLRHFDSPIRNQWDGTCTAHGLIAGMENLYNRKAPTQLSTRYFWSLYRKYNAKVAMDTAATTLQIEEKYWPQDSARAKAIALKLKGSHKLTGAAYLGSEVKDVVKALDRKFPVYAAMSVPQDMAACRATIRYSTGVTNGGHAVLISGYQFDSTIPGGGYLIIKNSWSAECGDRGYQYMPFGLCEKEGMYCIFWSLKSTL